MVQNQKIYINSKNSKSHPHRRSFDVFCDVLWFGLFCSNLNSMGFVCFIGLVWFGLVLVQTELYAPLALYCFCSFLFFGGFFVCVLLINWLFISKISWSLFVRDRMLPHHHQSPCLIRGHQR